MNIEKYKKLAKALSSDTHGYMQVIDAAVEKERRERAKLPKKVQKALALRDKKFHELMINGETQISESEVVDIL